MRDHKSKGCPHIFWGHTLKGKTIVEDVQWEVDTGGEVDVARRVLKQPITLGDVDCYDKPSLPHSLVLHPEEGRETRYET